MISPMKMQMLRLFSACTLTQALPVYALVEDAHSARVTQREEASLDALRESKDRALRHDLSLLEQ